MIQLLIIFIAIIVVACLLFKMWNKEATLEDARTIGLQEASSHINNPILLDDYIEAKRIPMEELEPLIGFFINTLVF